MADTEHSTPSPERSPANDVVPIIPMRSMLLFPGIVLPVALGRQESIAAAQEAVRSGRKIGLLLQHDANTEKPTAEDLHQVGVLASVVRYVTAPDGTHHLV